MITLNNNLSFNIIYNSGSLGFTGKGWLHQKPFIWLGILPIKNIPKITKTVTLNRIKNFPYLRIHKRYIVNRIGLSNKGLNYWLTNIYPNIRKQDLVILSVAEKDINSICNIVETVDKYSNICGLEINISCPSFNYQKNIEDIILELEYLKTTHPIFLKTGNKNNLDKLICNLKRSSKIEVININSYAIYRNHKWFGYSGKLFQEKLWNLARKIAINTAKPIIIPSVWSQYDVLKAKIYFKEYNNIAFGLASILLRNIFAVKSIIKQIKSI